MNCVTTTGLRLITPFPHLRNGASLLSPELLARTAGVAFSMKGRRAGVQGPGRAPHAQPQALEGGASWWGQDAGAAFLDSGVRGAECRVGGWQDGAQAGRGEARVPISKVARASLRPNVVLTGNQHLVSGSKGASESANEDIAASPPHVGRRRAPTRAAPSRVSRHAQPHRSGYARQATGSGCSATAPLSQTIGLCPRLHVYCH